MKWFRFYDEVLDDPKVQRLSPAMFRHWINLLCLANRNTERGVLPGKADIAFGLRISEAKVSGILADLTRAGLLDDLGDGTFQPHGWQRRQMVSDNVAERVAKHRAKQDVTLQETLPPNMDAVTETALRARATDTEQKQKQSRAKGGADAPAPDPSEADGAIRVLPGADPTPDLPAVQGNNPEHRLVNEYYRIMGGKPTNVGRALGNAKKLAEQHVYPGDLPSLIEWARQSRLGRDGFDLGTLVVGLDQWRSWKAERSRKANARSGLVFG